MRSRDGNYPQLLTSCLLIFISSILGADEYIISYHSATKNAKLLNEKISISRAMTPCHGVADAEITLYFSGSKNLKEIIKENRNEFLTYIQRHDLHVKSFASKGNNSYSDLTTLTMSPQCFIVTINESFAIISALK